jgi:lysyl endopeptidase
VGTYNSRGVRLAALGILVAIFSVAAMAVPVAVPVDIVKTDLHPLIRAASTSRVQFAVPVPHSVSTSTGGTWTTAGGHATWRYAIRVPTAVSLSFHATGSSLPASAVLIIRGAKTTTSYSAHDLHRGDLWSRIHPGDALELTLTVASEDRSKTSLNIVSVQAGYRSLGAGVADHPYYRKLMTQAAATGNTSCVTNYMCQVTPSNTPAGAATVAIMVANQYQCTGSLINDIPGDNTPYVLTARHCETGQLGGGDPGAAKEVMVYWDATTSCGTDLGSIYDPNVQTQAGAQTVVEQQDAWLIRLDVNPVVSDAQFAGFDASGGAVNGGYSIQHSEGYDKQFTAWFGQAAVLQESNVLTSTYLSSFLETVNQTGNVAPGASGSGLFDQNNHLVGSLTLGRTNSDSSGYGSCPATTPTAPDGTNGVADFTSLAAVWNSTADNSSSTGSTTLKAILDPGNTGTVVAPSEPAASIVISPFTTDIFFTGTTVGITWSAANATQCVASGGVAGDGWTGTLTNGATVLVTESTTGTVTYTITCTFPGGRSANASTSLVWVNQPQVQFNVPYVVWTTRPAVLSWSSNVTPCSITGGGLALTGLPASGTTTTTQATAGDVQYLLSCGPANNSDELGGMVQYVTPSLIFEANGTDRLLGQTFFLAWVTEADSCVPSGGAPGDGWATTAFGADGGGTQFAPKVTTAGTYTYTLTCSSGPISLQQSATVTFENNAPYVTASISSPSVTFSDSPADYSTLTWNSNLSNCSYASTPNLNTQTPSNPPFDGFIPFSTLPLPQGSLTVTPSQSGTYSLSITCTAPALNSTTVTSTPVTLTVLPAAPPTATLSINPSTVISGQNYTVSWTSTGASSCAQTGGIPNSSWGESTSPAGTVTESGGSAGEVTFNLTCQSIDPKQTSVSTQATVDVEKLTATLSSSSQSVTVGSAFTLTWSSTTATSCTPAGGGANGTPWSGTLGTSGSVTQTATAAGTFTYSILCTIGIYGAPAATTVIVTGQSTAGSGGSSTDAVSSTSGGGGHSGGGTLGWLELLVLAGFVGRGVLSRSQRVTP